MLSPLSGEGFFIVKMCKNVGKSLISVIINMSVIHPKLEEQIIALITLAKKEGKVIDYSSTKNEKSALIYNDDRVVLMTIREDKDCWLVQPYIVDIRRWAWAEDEGFSREDIWSDKSLQEMIFIPVTRQQLYTYVGIN